MSSETKSLVYRSPFIYELVMFLLYGQHYPARYRAIANLIPQAASVLDLCCGPATLYHRYLKSKSVDYLGLDINAAFIRRLIRAGARGQVSDLQFQTVLPTADYVLMHASLYHFLPDASPLVHRMLNAAHKQVIIAEPIINLADASVPLLSKIARRHTDPGSGQQAHRFTAQTLDELFSNFSSRVVHSFLIPGGREKVYVLNP